MVKTKTSLVIAGVIGATLLALSQIAPNKVAPKPVAAPREIKALPNKVYFPINNSNVVTRGSFVFEPSWTLAQIEAHLRKDKKWIDGETWIAACDDGGTANGVFPRTGDVWRNDIKGGAFVGMQPYSTWILNEQTCRYDPDIPRDQAKPYYVMPDIAKGESKGSWTSDKTKESPPAKPPADAKPPKADAPQVVKPVASIPKYDDSPYFYCARGDTLYWQVHCVVTIEYFNIAGGGGGGDNHGGGGGGGGFVTGSYSGAVEARTVTLGGGGGHDTSGTDSTITGLTTATGGGHGGSGANGANGGSGGGGSGDFPGSFTGGTGSQGSNGGTAAAFSFGPTRVASGGGGGKAAVGANGSVASGQGVGGNGGAGSSTGVWTTSNASATYSGGGGGSAFGDTVPVAGTGGAGGGGAGGVTSGTGTAGTANTGGGGGGGASVANGGAGGSGKAGFRYLIADGVTQTGGTASNDETSTVVLFTASGTFDVTAISGGGVNHAPDFFQYAPMKINGREYVFKSDFELEII